MEARVALNKMADLVIVVRKRIGRKDRKITQRTMVLIRLCSVSDGVNKPICQVDALCHSPYPRMVDRTSCILQSVSREADALARQLPA